MRTDDSPAAKSRLEAARATGRGTPWRLLAATLACCSLIYLLVGDAWPVGAAIFLGILAAMVDEAERGGTS
jgi:hypothetical protein